MEKMKDKVKKKKIKWRDVIFHLHVPKLSTDFDVFKAAHPKMSVNRCAYYVLKSYCSTTALRYIRNHYKKTGLTIQEVVEWYKFYLNTGVL